MIMRIETADFGPQEISPDTIIEFPNGIPGFEYSTQFKIFNEENARQVFHLQSVTHPDIAFSIVEPADLNVFYQISLSDDELALLGTSDPEQIGVLVLTYKNGSNPGDSESSGLSFSFMNPLIINLQGKKGFMKTLSKTSQQITIVAE